MAINQAAVEYEMRRAVANQRGNEYDALKRKANDMEKALRTILATAERSTFQAVGLVRLREIAEPALKAVEG